MLSGTFIYNSNNFSVPINAYNLYDRVISLSDYLDSNYKNKKIIITRDLISQLHQYNATIPMYYGRWEYSMYIEDILGCGDFDVINEYMAGVNTNGVDLIIIEQNDFYKYWLNATGWYVCDEYAGYDIYCPADDGWIIANYVDESGNQGMFYTVFNHLASRLSW